MNIALLQTLREAEGQFVSWPALLEHWPNAGNDIDALIAFGYSVEIQPILGVAYRGPCERLCPDQIEWNLNTRRIGRNIAVWNQLGSTNDLAARAASSRANDGLAIFAESQTAGRGSRGRVWVAPARSSILLSVLIFPPDSLDNPHWLTALGAVAVAEVVSEFCDVDARIKWPNDVRVNGRKIAGILVERTQGSVIGIGLNVNTAEDDFPADLREIASSMRRLTGSPHDRSDVAHALLRRLDHWYNAGISDGPASLDVPLHARSEHLNTDVIVETPLGDRTGRLEAIQTGRGVTLLAADGSRVHLESSDVRSLRTI